MDQVFSSIVQRAVDNDKRESGGARATSTSEFFVRHPALFPFLLSELGKIVNFSVTCDVNGWPQSVVATSSEIQRSEAVINPSLFPLLLLLSKMRAEALSGAASAGEDADESAAAAARANIALFVPLVQSCASSTSFQVRTGNNNIVFGTFICVITLFV